MTSEVKISGNRILITRVFDAPRQLVFAWWTQAEKLQQWSGCKAATRCEIKMDFRVGGSFTQKMHIAGAGEFSFTGKYDEIVEPERISYHADFGQVITRVVVEFFEQGQSDKSGSDARRIPERKFLQDRVGGDYRVARQTRLDVG